MRVTSNTSAYSLLDQIEKQRNVQADLQKKLSTQQNIHSASDDPVKFGQIKNAYSLERAMESYRSNLSRGNLIADISEVSLDFAKSIARQAIKTSELLQTQINDQSIMQVNTTLLNALIEQALDALNSRNGNSYLFSGSTTAVQPYEALRDTNGNVSGNGQQTIGAEKSITAGQVFELEVNNRYEILDDTGFDFTTIGAETGAIVGDTFVYNGEPIGAASAAASVRDVDPFDLAKGASYRIDDSSGLSSADWTAIGASAAAANDTIFTYNGDATAEAYTGETLTLVVGATYIIEDSEGLDAAGWTALGASSNAVGTKFVAADPSDATATTVTSSAATDFVSVTVAPSGTASVTQVAATISDASKMVVGKAYEIALIDGATSIGSTTDFMDSGAHTNDVGHQFIYNGSPPTFDGALLIPLAVDDTARLTSSSTLNTNGLYKVIDAAPNGQPLPNLVEGDMLEKGKIYRVDVAGGTNKDLSGIGVDADDSGAADTPANVEGTIFISNGTQPTKFDGVEFKEMVVQTDSTLTDTAVDGETYIVKAGLTTDVQSINTGDTLTLVVGRTYEIEDSTGIDFTALGASSDANGTRFVATAATSVAAAGTARISSLVPADLSDVGGPSEAVPVTQEIGTGESFHMISGKTYRIDDATGFDFTGLGAAANTVGTEFAYNGTAIPVATGSAAISTVVVAGADQENYMFTATGDGELPPGSIVQRVTTGTTVAGVTTTNVEEDKTYQIVHVAGTANDDFSAVSGIASLTTAEVGQIFTATASGAIPDGAAVVELFNAEMTSVEEGESFMIANVSAAVGSTPLKASDCVGDPDKLITDRSYTIDNNGSTLAMPGFAALGLPAALDAGTINTGLSFTVAGAVSDSDITLGSAEIVDTATNMRITSVSDFAVGSTYQVVDDGSSIDFTSSGAVDNRVGSSFVYNGVPPSFGAIVYDEKGNVTSEAELSYTTPSAEFTRSGAADNNVGTMFTANSTAAEFGASGALYKLQVARTDATDFTDSGASSNELGTKFVYNGTAPVFGDNNGDGGALFAYKREALAVAYVGADFNVGRTGLSAEDDDGFYMAESTKINPFTDVKFNQQFQDFLNGLVKLRDAYQEATDANDQNDDIARDTALERAKEAVAMIDQGDEDILSAIAEQGATRLNMEVAEAKDNRLFKNREDMIARSLDINEVEVVARLNQSLNAFQGTLSAGARTMQLSILDYI